MAKRVFNQQPIVRAPYRIALVGEAPGAEEDMAGLPFIGISGKLLNGMLRESGIDRAACFVGNCYQYRPPGNKMEAVDKRSPEWLESQAALIADLKEFKPQVIVPLGSTALHQLTGRHGLDDLRGSCLRLPEAGKVALGCDPLVIPTYHPAFILRQWEWHAIAILDLSKALRECVTPKGIPSRNFEIAPDCKRVLSYLARLEERGRPFAFDIETTIKEKTLLCVGFSDFPDHALVVPMQGWDPVEEALIWTAFRRVMANPRVPKIAHNAQFDMGVLELFYNTPVNGLWMDTMLAHHACYPELPKSLAFCASIYTNEPYWKDKGRKSEDEKGWTGAEVFDMSRLYTYNAKDSAVTLECALALDKELDSLGARKGYEIDMASIPTAMEMTKRGVLVSVDKCRERLTALEGPLKASHDKLQEVFGKYIPEPPDRYGKSRTLKDGTVKPGNLLKKKPKPEVNSKSVKMLKDLFYERMHLPKQFKKGKLSVDADAILRLTRLPQGRELMHILKDRQMRTQASFFELDLHSDGRLHPGFNVAGTETGRWSSSGSVLGGRNMMNIPEECRDIYVADPGFVMIGFDQSQAEARVVAYKGWLSTTDHSYKTLLESGQKPHIWLGCQLVDRGIFPESARAEILAKKGIYYLLAKKAIHGFSYGLGPNKFRDVLIKETDGEVVIEVALARRIKEALYASLTVIPAWQSAVQKHLSGGKFMANSFGRARVFMERWGDDLFGEAYAFEPQSTVADNTATTLVRLKQEFPDLQLLQQGYDSVLCQVPETWDIHKTCARIKELAERPIRLANFEGTRHHDIVIPVELKVGKSWGELKGL